MGREKEVLNPQRGQGPRHSRRTGEWGRGRGPGCQVEVDDIHVALALLDAPRSLAGEGHTTQNEAVLGPSPQSEVRASMRLHSAPRSGNSYKVRLLLGLLGTSCEVVDYETKGGETHAPEFLKDVNPDGKVPVLELEDGTMLPESGANLHYLAGVTPYLPEEKLERAQVLRWMFFEQYSRNSQNTRAWVPCPSDRQ
jgi:hypothetical protein